MDRRSFLQLFGATVALAAVPVKVVGVVEATTSPVLGWPIIGEVQVLMKDGWSSLGQCISIAINDRINSFQIDTPRGLRSYRGTRDQEAIFTFEEIIKEVSEFLMSDDRVRMRTNVCGDLYEFSSLVMSVTSNFDAMDSIPTFDMVVSIFDEVVIIPSVS